MATFFWMEVGDTKKPFDQSLPKDEQPPALEEEVPTLMEENTVITEDPSSAAPATGMGHRQLMDQFHSIVASQSIY